MSEQEKWLREIARQLHMEGGWTGEANTCEQVADAYAELQAELLKKDEELAAQREDFLAASGQLTDKIAHLESCEVSKYQYTIAGFVTGYDRKLHDEGGYGCRPVFYRDEVSQVNSPPTGEKQS